jgi:hypothetical protein
LSANLVNIGNTANDGTGDAIRVAFQKVNDNFSNIHSSFVMTGALTVGNATINTVVSNTGGLVVSNSSSSTVANVGLLKIGNSTTNATLSSLQLSIIANSTIGNAVVNSSIVSLGNSTVNTSYSVGTLQLANSTTNTTITRSSIFVGNSSANMFANSTYLKVAQANVTSNTLTLGTSTDGANGYTYLPNGFKLNWGKVSANSSAGTILFNSSYTTNVYVVTLTSSNNLSTYSAIVSSQNNTIAEIRTANNTAVDVYYTAIGK